MAAPTITKGLASHYASQNETIREFGNGKCGGLISMRTLDDGSILVELYGMDDSVRVSCPEAQLMVNSHA